MSWNDGATKQLNLYFEQCLDGFADEVIPMIKEVIDKYADNTYDELKKSTPQSSKNNSVHLVDRLKKERITNKGPNYYGFRIYFEGDFKNGTKIMSYEKLANILNYGSFKKVGLKEYQNVKPTKFISKAIKKLKNINVEISDKYHELERKVMK